MVLNYIWIGFFLIALVVAIVKTFMGDVAVFSDIVQSTFSMSETAFEIALYLTGVLCFWLGIMKIGEKGGAVQLLAKAVGPFFNKLFPDVPADHPARGAMLMNFSANMLGLDNAATPMGLKAMTELQSLNDQKERASNAMIMFLVLNTSGLTLIPVAVMNYRSQYGAENPSDVFIPILIATFFASLVGLIVVALYQRINLLDKVVIAYIGGFSLLVFGLIYYFHNLDSEAVAAQSSLLSNIILYGLICGFIIMGLTKKVNIYEAFIEGAKDGFGIAVKIIPYLIAILVSIAVFRASGAMDFLLEGAKSFFSLMFDNVQFVEGLPTAMMKPLSGTGARGMMIDAFDAHGVDSYQGFLSATLQGATDTTFYIIAVYFGSVGIRKTRYAVKAGLLADLGGVVAAILIAGMFYGGSTVERIPPKDLVNGFVTNWSEGNANENMSFMNESCVLYDMAFDTISKSNKEITSKYLETIDISPEIISLKSTGNTPTETVWVKCQTEGATKEVLGYQFSVKQGKISAIKYLGLF